MPINKCLAPFLLSMYHHHSSLPHAPFCIRRLVSDLQDYLILLIPGYFLCILPAFPCIRRLLSLAGSIKAKKVVRKKKQGEKKRANGRKKIGRLRHVEDGRKTKKNTKKKNGNEEIEPQEHNGGKEERKIRNKKEIANESASIILVSYIIPSTWIYQPPPLSPLAWFLSVLIYIAAFSKSARASTSPEKKTENSCP